MYVLAGLVSWLGSKMAAARVGRSGGNRSRGWGSYTHITGPIEEQWQWPNRLIGEGPYAVVTVFPVVTLQDKKGGFLSGSAGWRWRWPLLPSLILLGYRDLWSLPLRGTLGESPRKRVNAETLGLELAISSSMDLSLCLTVPTPLVLPRSGPSRTALLCPELPSTGIFSVPNPTLLSCLSPMYAHVHLLYKVHAAARGRGHVSVWGSLQPIRDQVLDRQKGARPGYGGKRRIWRKQARVVT